ncbi:hypothetical protein IHE44_0007595 [Lamprotornis superbus]|uniref:CASTOR1 N-terminal domain-containing protein n=1 Tax=Lamprotornis superbus TaxID=245042 RepID=A0A835NQA7_9PASS|nr:hypothetical protein IHE44_0007595 [Lamprotornis superbus]
MYKFESIVVCKFFSLTETPEDYTIIVDEEGFLGTKSPELMMDQGTKPSFSVAGELKKQLTPGTDIHNELKATGLWSMTRSPSLCHSIKNDSHSLVQLMLAEDAVPLVVGEASVVQLGTEILGDVQKQGRFLTRCYPTSSEAEAEERICLPHLMESAFIDQSPTKDKILKKKRHSVDVAVQNLEYHFQRQSGQPRLSSAARCKCLGQGLRAVAASPGREVDISYDAYTEWNFLQFFVAKRQ